jgi:hypothetical protein
MAEKNFVSDLTVQNATETVKTTATAYEAPLGCKALREVGVQIVPNGAVTDDEDYSGILEIEADNASSWGGTQQFATGTLVKKTSGAVFIPATVHDCDIAIQPGTKLKFSMTFNKALTTTPSWRAFGKFV